MNKPSLYYPVKPLHINQHFGDNIPCVKDFGLSTQDIVSGLDNTTCPIGYDKLYSHWSMSGHNGTDLMAGEQNVYATMDGVVVEQQTVESRGLGLGILSKEILDLGSGGEHYLKLRYWHLKSFAVNAGDSVVAGQLIGISDNTGYSSGNHLHFEGQPMDKDTSGHLTLSNPSGNIAGAIDIEPYFNGMFAQDIQQINSLLSNLVIVLTKLLNYLKSNK
jgi:murein DD-endopeptidase MepM/ murein hydrolase activator NlpD